VVEALARTMNQSHMTDLQLPRSRSPVAAPRGLAALAGLGVAGFEARHQPEGGAPFPLGQPAGFIGRAWPGRARRARARMGSARRVLRNCQLCAHQCGVDRVAGERGNCRAGLRARCFGAQTEVNDEPELAPCFAIALSGCDLRCDFCISGLESWNPEAGDPVAALALARQATCALASGARSVMILGGEPTIHLPTVLELVSNLPEAATLVWKTNAHGTAQSRALLEGLFDVWVADYKFGNDTCAARLAQVPHYTLRVRENLRWAAVHTRLIVRHLLMPGHIDCCWRPVATWLAQALPGVTVSLRSGFWPGWFSRRHAELRRTTCRSEVEQAHQIAHQCGLQTRS
jgi:putative pyruvate formate lyase activating enzyme